MRRQSLWSAGCRKLNLDPIWIADAHRSRNGAGRNAPLTQDAPDRIGIEVPDGDPEVIQAARGGGNGIRRSRNQLKDGISDRERPRPARSRGRGFPSEQPALITPRARPAPAQ